MTQWIRLLITLIAAAAAALGAGPAAAGGVDDRVAASGTVRVCIWPEYYGISWHNPRTGRLQGLDIDLSAEFAREIGRRLEYVPTTFATLIDDLVNQRCDAAMFGVAITPQRAQHLRFTTPYLRSGIVAATLKGHPTVQRWQDIDRPGVRVAVAAGTFMEPVMSAALKHASLVSVRAPATREEELRSGRVDVFMTDFPYSRRLLAEVDWAQIIEPETPFHPLGYAYAVRPGDDAWFARLQGFAERIRRDGRLAAAARGHGLVPIALTE